MVNEVKLEIRGLDGVLNALQALPKLVASRNGGPVRASLEKGAAVLVEAIKHSVAKHRETGILGSSIKQWRAQAKYQPEVHGKNGELIRIGVWRKEYPIKNPHVLGMTRKGRYRLKDRRKKGNPQTRRVGRFLEWGTPRGRQKATPFLRPAVASVGSQVIEAVRSDLIDSVDKAAQSLLPK